MLAIASQIVLCLALAALIGLIIGYLIGKVHCPKETYKAVAPYDPHTEDDGNCVESSDLPDEEKALQEDTLETAVTEEDSATSHNESAPASPSEESQDRINQSETSSDTKTQIDTDDIAKDTSGGETASKKKEEDKDNDGTSDNHQSISDETASDETRASAENSTLDEETDVAPSDDDKPAGLLESPDGEKDNLTRIKGIGIKIESQLNSIGVYHFRQIAAWTEKELNWVAHHTSFPGRALRDDWIGQAKLLAEGKETEFSKRVDSGEVASSHKS